MGASGRRAAPRSRDPPRPAILDGGERGSRRAQSSRRSPRDASLGIAGTTARVPRVEGLRPIACRSRAGARAVSPCATRNAYRLGGGRLGSGSDGVCTSPGCSRSVSATDAPRPQSSAGGACAGGRRCAPGRCSSPPRTASTGRRGRRAATRRRRRPRPPCRRRSTGGPATAGKPIASISPGAGPIRVPNGKRRSSCRCQIKARRRRGLHRALPPLSAVGRPRGPISRHSLPGAIPL